MSRLSLAREVHEALEGAGIDHAVAGAVALAVHGAPRSTQDLDFVAVDGAALQPDLWNRLRAVAEVDIRRGDFDDPLLGVVRLNSPAADVQVDVVVTRSAWLRPLLVRAKVANVGGVSLPVVGPVELVLLKLDAGGPKDLWDVHQLLDARLDSAGIVEAVSSQVIALPQALRESWSRVLGERGLDGPR